MLDRGIRGHFAMIEHVPTVLLRIVLALRGEHHRLVRDGVNLAVAEDGLGISENEVHVTFDVAIGEKLARRDTRSLFRLASFAAGKQRVLRAQNAHVAKHGAVAADGQRNGLRALRSRLAVLAEVVGKGDAARKEVVSFYVNGRRIQRPAGGAGALIKNDDDLRWVR